VEGITLEYFINILIQQSNTKEAPDTQSITDYSEFESEQHHQVEFRSSEKDDIWSE
jgi:hypothetical protein